MRLGHCIPAMKTSSSQYYYIYVEKKKELTAAHSGEPFIIGIRDPRI